MTVTDAIRRYLTPDDYLLSVLETTRLPIIYVSGSGGARTCVNTISVRMVLVISSGTRCKISTQKQKKIEGIIIFWFVTICYYPVELFSSSAKSLSLLKLLLLSESAALSLKYANLHSPPVHPHIFAIIIVFAVVLIAFTIVGRINLLFAHRWLHHFHARAVILLSLATVEGMVIPNASFWSLINLKSQKTISNVYTMLNAGKIKKSAKEILVNLIYCRIIPYVPEIAISRLWA